MRGRRKKTFPYNVKEFRLLDYGRFFAWRYEVWSYGDNMSGVCWFQRDDAVVLGEKHPLWWWFYFQRWYRRVFGVDRTEIVRSYES